MTWWKRSERGLAPSPEKKSLPEGVWTKCSACGEILLEADYEQNWRVCATCGFHASLPAKRRIEQILDHGSFVEHARRIEPVDRLGFIDTKKYKDRLKSARKQSGQNEAVVVGIGRLEGQKVGLGVLAFEFMGGSMGSVVGERIARLFELACEERCPVIMCSSSGGARMQEGVLSLMQLAKTTGALQRLRAAGLPYISVLLHPTTGGVAASFAMLGDVNVAEPGALIGFAGPRVIEQTIRQKLPEGFQRAEFLLEHGMVDMVVARQELRERLAFLVRTLMRD